MIEQAGWIVLSVLFIALMVALVFGVLIVYGWVVQRLSHSTSQPRRRRST
jgi:hypothetical protein